jgi:peptide deformylase
MENTNHDLPKLSLKEAIEKNQIILRYYLEDPDPILSTVCLPVEVDEFGETANKFGELLLAQLAKHSTGIGLAAPQVGVLRRVFVVFNHKEKKPIVAFNPLVIPSGDEWVYDEGCLSVPGVYNQVSRPKNAVLRYQDTDGDEQRVELEMLDARVAQHENDHLNGIMFFDKMTRQMRKATLRDWKNERRKRGL